MLEWLSLSGAVSLVRTLVGWVGGALTKRAASVEYRTASGKWRRLGRSARTERDGELLQTWDQKSQDYLLLLNQEDYDASGVADRTDTVTVRWREDGHFVEAVTQCIGPDRQRGDGLMEIELRRDM